MFVNIQASISLLEQLGQGISIRHWDFAYFGSRWAQVAQGNVHRKIAELAELKVEKV